MAQPCQLVPLVSNVWVRYSELKIPRASALAGSTPALGTAFRTTSYIGVRRQLRGCAKGRVRPKCAHLCRADAIKRLVA